MPLRGKGTKAASAKGVPNAPTIGSASGGTSGVVDFTVPEISPEGEFAALLPLM